jgi:hypothetical protein
MYETRATAGLVKEMLDEWMGRELLACLEVLLRGSRQSRDTA